MIHFKSRMFLNNMSRIDSQRLRLCAERSHPVTCVKMADPDCFEIGLWSYYYNNFKKKSLFNKV